MIIIYTLLIPLVGALTSAITNSAKLRDIINVIITIILFVNILNLLGVSARGEAGEVIIAEPISGLPIKLFLEPLGLIFALVASFLWMVTTIYSIGYMNGNKEPRQNQFYVFFAIAIFAALGISFAGNLLTLFIFYEILTLSTYPLVTHHRDEKSKKSGRIYLGILLSTSLLFFLPAILITWNQAGTLDFVVGGILKGNSSPVITGILLFLFMYGIGKAALMPIHRWLPAAMVAPTPVSALLHAVAVVKAGVFTIVKVIVYIFGVDHLSNMIELNWWAGGWLIYISGATIILASIVALRQDNLKARLAYSTISQLSYIIMATAILAPISIMAAAFHIAAHAFGKITLFFAAGAIYTASKKTKVSELSGIGKQMPITMAAFTIGSLSMIGIPPMVGFLTKYYMVVGALQQGAWFAISVIIISTLLNAAYFLPIVQVAFFKKPVNKKSHGEAPLPMLIALVITATMTIGLFFYPDTFLWLSSLVGGV
jgi:multicomponent Na+:H+ antiporter subunit D